MAAYGRLCGWTLARAHARSGDRIAIAAYLGKSAIFDRAIVEFSHAYAEQNERDYKALTEAVDPAASPPKRDSDRRRLHGPARASRWARMNRPQLRTPLTRRPLLEIDAALAAGGRQNPTPHRATEERGGLGQLGKAVLVDLGAVDGDRRQLLIAEAGRSRTGSAHRRAGRGAGAGSRRRPAGRARSRRPHSSSVSRRHPCHGDSPVSSICAARDRPARLVGGLQDQQPAGPSRRSAHRPRRGSAGSPGVTRRRDSP